MKKATGGGAFEPDGKFIYFVANFLRDMKQMSELANHQLIAVNEIESESDLHFLQAWCEIEGNKLFVDSGIYNLAATHARKHNVSINDALSLAPEEIDGFEALFENYCRTIDFLGEVCWGYTELDQGGRENKIRMRARLEAMGYRPMPIYHPLVDGWEYYDELASGYDRFCFANIGQVSVPAKLRLMATSWERQRQYPGTWIHYLGATASAYTLAFPGQSCDSSSWAAVTRWGRTTETACARIIGDLGYGFAPRHGEVRDPSLNQRYRKLSMNKARLLGELHRTTQQAFLDGLGLEREP